MKVRSINNLDKIDWLVDPSGPLLPTPMYYRCVFPDSRKRANDHSALKQAQTSNRSEPIFHRKENRKPNCANRLITYSTGNLHCRGRTNKFPAVTSLLVT